VNDNNMRICIGLLFAMGRRMGQAWHTDDDRCLYAVWGDRSLDEQLIQRYSDGGSSIMEEDRGRHRIIYCRRC